MSITPLKAAVLAEPNIIPSDIFFATPLHFLLAIFLGASSIASMLLADCGGKGRKFRAQMEFKKYVSSQCECVSDKLRFPAS